MLGSRGGETKTDARALFSQSGYNLCNSTTVGPNSQCQTAITNNISDFCLWGSPTPGGSIGDVEAAVVAYCTTDKHGTRVIPPGAITGLQVCACFHRSCDLVSRIFRESLQPHAVEMRRTPSKPSLSLWTPHEGRFCFPRADLHVTNTQQVMHTSEYIQWTGHIDMTALGLLPNDTGGELDPHGCVV